jgi:adenine-specific DNA-methyltransferase
MATGQPQSRKARNRASETTPVELNYPGKRPTIEILATPPGRYERVQGDSLDKRLYFAENLQTLASLTHDQSVCGKVRLVYIDPPYATQTIFRSRKLTHAFEDVFETSEYLEFLRERLILLHRILADDGSFYLHIDDKMLFHAKLLLDEIFGPDNFRNCITRRKCNPKNYTRKTYGNIADYLLFYSKSPDYVWNRQVEPWTADTSKEYQYVEAETGRRFMKVPVHAPGSRNGETGKPWRGILPPPGKHWQFTPATLDELDAKGEVFWSKNGNPRRKVYLDQSDGVSVQDIWTDFRDAHNQNVEITGYPTEKNVNLLRRIVAASSNTGDLVLDCFAGSGTTLVAADELGRNWIGIDNSPEAWRTMLHRFSNGSEIMGDFVKERKGNAVKSHFLFDLLPGGLDQASKPKKRIEGFSVFAAPDDSNSIRKLLGE